MTQQQMRAQETVGNFYSAMSRTTSTAASLCHRMTPHNASLLRRSLVDAIRCVDELRGVIEPRDIAAAIRN